MGTGKAIRVLTISFHWCYWALVAGVQSRPLRDQLVQDLPRVWDLEQLGALTGAEVTF
jgi:hypothetical protein